MLGPGARFRPDQWEAIAAVAIQGERVLLVQRTGWGKSVVYFLATRLLRDRGAGPTLLISPLLSLIRNQIDMAGRIGIRAASLNSTNPDDWAEIEADLRKGDCDVLLVSPERLANAQFRENLVPVIQGSIGLFVVDEAHCISDWGHDFRPDYRRIVRILQSLPVNVPVLATTATANDRVMEDVAGQLGPNLRVVRGSLARPTLRLQTIRLADQAERLAWLLDNVPSLPGTGIIYCLTVHDCRRVSSWLQIHGIEAAAYYGDLDSAAREDLEGRLIRNDVKVLVATVALGMGFDKPDLGFVVHYQRPGSPVTYYQQIGRAGRGVDDAYVVLLNGREDDDIQEYFIRTALPSLAQSHAVLDVIEDSDGLTVGQIENGVNISRGMLERVLKLLEVDETIAHQGARYVRTLNPWIPDPGHLERVTATRHHELAEMREYVTHSECLLEFLARQLDDPTAGPCGRCANCSGGFVPTEVPAALVQEARTFLQGDTLRIEPRRVWPAGTSSAWRGADRQNAEGCALSIYGDAGWGRIVAEGKYVLGTFSDDLVEASATLILERWRPDPFPEWVTAVPSLRHPELVPSFAQRLAARLRLPFHPVIVKANEMPEQKTMQNSAQQMRNVASAFEVAACPEGPVLLVDDIVDSRWTMTVCGQLLKDAGSGPVYPFALASASGG